MKVKKEEQKQKLSNEKIEEKTENTKKVESKNLVVLPSNNFVKVIQEAVKKRNLSILSLLLILLLTIFVLCFFICSSSMRRAWLRYFRWECLPGYYVLN
jgi:hypothetical protein